MNRLLKKERRKEGKKRGRKGGKQVEREGEGREGRSQESMGHDFHHFCISEKDIWQNAKS